MVVLTKEDLDQAEAAILSILSDETEPMPPERLFERLEERGIPNFPSRAAMWSLIDRQKIDFTSKRLLKLPDVSESNGARLSSSAR
jgi:hypothetical protein